MRRKFLKGAYFTYCQWCRRDKYCLLRHYQFSGMKSVKKVDDSPYSGHEDLRWHLSGFQGNTGRAACRGRIFETESIFYPLQCECGTAISSLVFSSVMGAGFCAKFRPNEKEKERVKKIHKASKKIGVDISELNEEYFPVPDPDYEAAMMY